MKNTLAYLFLFFLFVYSTSAQTPDLTKGWKFKTGDAAEYARPDFNDADWKPININSVWENQGYPDYDGYAWYRVHFTAPSSVKQGKTDVKSVRLMLGMIDDVDVTYLNGVKIGQTGSLPTDSGGYQGAYNVVRRYMIAANDPAIRWDADNVIAVRVYDGGGGGGIYRGPFGFDAVDVMDSLRLDAHTSPFIFTADNQIKKTVEIQNTSTRQIEGTLKLQGSRGDAGAAQLFGQKKLAIIPAGQTYKEAFTFANVENAVVQFEFTERQTGKVLSERLETPYVLTPKEKPAPALTGATVYGERPGKPFLFRLTATGERPLKFSAAGLPAGLKLDAATGIITGQVAQAGNFAVSVAVSNALGKSERTLTIKIGDQLALTPPMGWNSWNCWGLSVNEERVKQSANALKTRGLINHGWTYINIDDGWEAARRDASGAIVSNEKFPDMKRLTDYIHGMGLKMGIYSSPGPQTCGNFLGSYQHEAQDAHSYDQWGFDYLKYDWCSYGNIDKKPDLAGFKKPYQVMKKALDAANRDIVFSFCQYGMGDVWKWGGETGGNLWRTTGDIEDTWSSLSGIGFQQNIPAPYAKPGNWNDPDMMVVGWVGWGDHLHETRLTPNEQYTHVSLWAMESAPLLIGCDLSRIDDFTYNLLSNDDVLAIDQDPAGKAALPVVKNDAYQIWVKELADGSKAVAIFNMSEDTQKISVDWPALGVPAGKRLRDAWKMEDAGTTEKTYVAEVYRHGVKLLTVR